MVQGKQKLDFDFVAEQDTGVLSGEWTATDSVQSRAGLEWMLKALQGSELTLDLSNLRFLDSSAIQLLVELSTRLKKQGKTLRLAKVPPMLMKIFRIIHLSSMFTIEALEE